MSMACALPRRPWAKTTQRKLPNRRHHHRWRPDRSRAASGRRGSVHCVECGDDIPDARRKALPGVRTCVTCQSGRNSRIVMVGAIVGAARTASCADGGASRHWTKGMRRMPLSNEQPSPAP